MAGLFRNYRSGPPHRYGRGKSKAALIAAALAMLSHGHVVVRRGGTTAWGYEPAPETRESESHEAMAARIATQNGMDPALIAAIITVESRWNPEAEGVFGERGLMQISRQCWNHLKTSKLAPTGDTFDAVWDPEVNILAGVRYLQLAKQYCVNRDPEKSSTEYVLSCYNAGFYKVHVEWKGEIRNRAYVQKVMETYRRIQSAEAKEASSARSA